MAPQGCWDKWIPGSRLRAPRKDDSSIRTRHDLPATPPRPSVAKFSLPLTSEGAGNAGCESAPAASCAKIKSTRASHHRFAGSHRHSLRNGFTTYSALSPVNRASCHRHLQVTLAGLTPASGRQDHTASPSACFHARLAKSQRPLLPAPRSWRSRAAPPGGTGCAKAYK